jgi:hypothetical protein
LFTQLALVWPVYKYYNIKYLYLHPIYQCGQSSMGKRKKRKNKKQNQECVQENAPEVNSIVRLLSEIPAAKLDLHGLTGYQAESRVRDFLATHRQVSRGRVLHIITGKGTHSDGPAVLPGVVSRLLREDLSDDLDEMAGLVGGGGIALRVGE